MTFLLTNTVNINVHKTYSILSRFFFVFVDDKWTNEAKKQ
nr:MAG TPA: hypothetical protein [Caudoviricetes sp.]